MSLVLDQLEERTCGTKCAMRRRKKQGQRGLSIKQREPVRHGPAWQRLPREVNGSADIGAYERQFLDDEIFYGGME